MMFAAIFGIVVGVLMCVQWVLTILKKQVAGPESGVSGRGRVEMAYHLVAEFCTALLLLFAGVSLITKMSWGLTLFLIADGMLIYTVINSPGFFAQQRQWPMVIFFAVLLVLAVFCLILVF